MLEAFKKALGRQYEAVCLHAKRVHRPMPRTRMECAGL